MSKDVVMPALGMAQETGTLVQWLKPPGAAVARGEPLMEIETDKATVEIEAPADGILSNVTAQPGDVIPVGQVIATLLTPGEAPSTKPAATMSNDQLPPTATPLAARIAREHNIELAQVITPAGLVRKDDVLAYLAARSDGPAAGRVRASPKARRLATERSVDLTTVPGTGPEGAVLATDVLAVAQAAPASQPLPEVSPPHAQPVGRLWHLMAERVTQAWTTIPHFYLLREAQASALVAWRNSAQARSPLKISYTDLLIKLLAAALRRHPRLNAAWQAGEIVDNREINVGLAVAVEDGLIVPVIHNADLLGLSALAARRTELVAKAQAGRLAPADLGGGTFTLSNLGMYGVDAFNAIINPPQAAILAVGRIADRVVPVNGQPGVQPMLTLSLACDHRVVDGARGATFLQTLAELIEAPLRALD